jgi:hypothetical protein
MVEECEARRTWVFSSVIDCGEKIEAISELNNKGLLKWAIFDWIMVKDAIVRTNFTRVYNDNERYYYKKLSLRVVVKQFGPAL